MDRISTTRQAVAVLSSALILPVVLHLLLRKEETLPSKRLILGVLSARDHFSQREAIRQTWGSLVHGLSDVEMKFVLGDQDCFIHPANRISPYGCEMWYLTEDFENNGPKSFFKPYYSQNKKNLKSLLDCTIGIGFKVLHPIIVERLMIQMKVIKRSSSVALVLSDPEEVIEQVILSHTVCVEEGDLCIFKLPHRLWLPKGFEGELRVVNTHESEDLCGVELYDLQDARNWVCDWNNSSVLEYRFLRTRKNTLTKWYRSSCALVLAQFTIANKSALMGQREQQEQQAKEWRQHLANLQQKVEEEESRHQDLLILPHLDVYTYLPQKVMAFLKWATHKHNFSYVMKVDDDTYVNVNLLDLLVDVEKEEDHVWWSFFHHHRSVPAYGKWADFTYPSLTYPTFPAGAGYLMTRSLAHSVVSAQDHLAPHGGEDVSMGIWVSSVSAGARHVEVPCWLPDPFCYESVLVPQLSVQQVMEMWQNMTDEVVE